MEDMDTVENAKKRAEYWKAEHLAGNAEIERLREALRLSTNGLRHCSRWNISDEKEKAIMTQVIANELLLTPRGGAAAMGA